MKRWVDIASFIPDSLVQFEYEIKSEKSLVVCVNNHAFWRNTLVNQDVEDNQLSVEMVLLPYNWLL